MTGRRMLLTAALLAATMGLGLSDVALANDKCTLATLKGRYLFATTGSNIVESVPQPISIVEVIDANGDGTLNVPAVTLSVNGTILRFADVSGSYTVNEDCTGTITFVTEVHLDIFIAPNGKEFYLIQTDPNTVLAAVARRVSRK